VLLLYSLDFNVQKLVIVKRGLEWDNSGHLKKGPSLVSDVDVREIWQPWLKHRCDFVVRYIVPNRANIIEILEGQGRFRAEVSWASSAIALITVRPITCYDRNIMYRWKLTAQKTVGRNQSPCE
jgi:hypothetical protein